MEFEDALAHTLEFEGGYANDTADPGGETYKGISRRAHPAWPGWVLVEEAKKGSGGKASAIDARLRGDQRVETLVEELYRKSYWDPLGELPGRVRMKAFDVAVNAGLGRAARILQEAANALGAGIRVDGIIGPATRAAVSSRPEDEVVGAMAKAQASFYEAIVRANPARGKFLRGWLRRAAWRP